jgi:hypothetical protein
MYISDPAKITIGGVTFLAKGAISINETPETWGVTLSTVGESHRVVSKLMHRITLVPDGRVNADILAFLFANANAALGSQTHSGSGTCVIHTVSGYKRTYANAALVPRVRCKLGTKGTVFDSIEILCVPPSAGGALFADTTGTAYDGVADFDPAEIISGAPVLSWGSAPWNSFHSQDEIDLSFEAQTEAVDDMKFGTTGLKITNIQVSAMLTPVGPTPAEVATAFAAASQGIGAVFAGAKNTLTIGQTGLWMWLTGCQIEDSSRSHDSRAQVQGRVTFKASRSLTDGVGAALLTVDVAD